MKIFCLHTLPEVKGQPKAEHILRTLKINEYYYFYSGYDINNAGENVEIHVNRSVPYNLYTELFVTSDLSIDICAIVGQNGAGKSSLIDLLLRIINNYAAVILGEQYISKKSEHLHYVDNVYAEIYYEKDGLIWCLGCKNREMYLKRFKSEGGPYYECTGLEKTFTKGNDYREERKCLDNLFYTILSNYSLHAFGMEPYLEELTSLKEEYEIRKKGIADKLLNVSLPTFDGKENRFRQSDVNLSDRLWLTSLFYKNDGYQTPIVITPKRNDGQIDIENEKRLSSERLLSLLFTDNGYGNESSLGFNEINEKLIITGFCISKNLKFIDDYKNDRKAYQEAKEGEKEKIEALLRIVYKYICKHSIAYLPI